MTEFVTIEKGLGPRTHRRGALRPRRRHQRAVAGSDAPAHGRRPQLRGRRETSVSCSPAGQGFSAGFDLKDAKAVAPRHGSRRASPASETRPRLTRPGRRWSRSRSAPSRLLRWWRRGAGGGAGLSRHGPRCPSAVPEIGSHEHELAEHPRMLHLMGRRGPSRR